MVSPRRPCVRIRLNMKLQSICPASKPKCLLRVHLARSQQYGTLRQCKCIAVPMECRQDIADLGEERILLACLCQGYRAEADFCSMSRKDLASKRLCK